MFYVYTPSLVYIAPVYVNNDISIFWKALIENGVEKNGRHWTLRAGVPWIGKVDTFYNRECYDMLSERIKEKKLALIVGTPGIGKTMFLQRLLVDIVESVQPGGTVPIIDYVTAKDDTVQRYRLLPNGSVIFGMSYRIAWIFLTLAVPLLQLKLLLITNAITNYMINELPNPSMGLQL